MTGIRRAAVAGRFYPREPERLAATVDRLLDAVEVPGDEPLAAAYVVPHAGYAYSGPTAAQVFARLRRHASAVERVVLAGPAHFVPLVGCAVPAVAAWATPLGEFPVVEEPGLADHAVCDDTPHASEHSLEVQLPLLRRALGRPVPILPIAVGRSTTTAVAAALTAATGQPGTVVLCSTDLSHYQDLATASAQDARTAAAVVALAHDQIGVKDACGCFALRGLLGWAAGAALRAAAIRLTTSAETAGGPERVVGYGAFAFYPKGDEISHKSDIAGDKLDANEPPEAASDERGSSQRS